MYVVYCLRSLRNGQLYIGLTSNLKRRIKEHNNGENKSTKGFKPYELIFTEEYEIRIDARRREKYLKSGCGREFINANWPRSSTG